MNDLLQQDIAALKGGKAEGRALLAQLLQQDAPNGLEPSRSVARA